MPIEFWMHCDWFHSNLWLFEQFRYDSIPISTQKCEWARAHTFRKPNSISIPSETCRIKPKIENSLYTMGRGEWEFKRVWDYKRKWSKPGNLTIHKRWILNEILDVKLTSFRCFLHLHINTPQCLLPSPPHLHTFSASHSLSLAIFLIINLFEFDNRQEYSRRLPQIYFICTKFRANKLTTSIRNRCCVCVTFFYIFSSVAFSHFTHKIFFGFSPFVLFWIYEQCVEAKPHLN